ncbi:MAG: hypothetical protein ACI863_000223 [Flavobacteriales bacterium]|jgi:hypothetical protein
MIKFFRKIRYDFMEKNKTGKYFKYAIGEIVLVVIGILIALSINNWNENRKDEKRIDAFIQKLKTQTENNITKIVNNIQYFDSNYQTSIRLISIIGTDATTNIEAKIDSLVDVNSDDYHLNLDLNVVIEDRENGDIALLKSDILRQELYNLSTENAALIERERIINEDLNILFVPYLNKNFNYRNGTFLKNIGKSNLYKGDNSKMLNAQEFENYIINRIEYNHSTLQLYKKMKQDLEAMSQLLSSI